MKLKCIGGKCDGMTVNIPNKPHYRLGDVLRVPNYPTSVSEMEFVPTIPTITVDYLVYQIDVLKYSKEEKEIWFLRPTNFTTWDAVQFQFLK